jgi:hypothetical protein
MIENTLVVLILVAAGIWTACRVRRALSADGPSCCGGCSKSCPGSQEGECEHDHP